MTYEEMMAIGESCGLKTVGECYNNVMHHYDAFFIIDNLNEETLFVKRIHKDLRKLSVSHKI